MAKGFKLLYRYTSLAPAIDILSSKRLSLRSPANWLDRNDAEYLEMFKRAMGWESLYALCMTQRTERFHHWYTFAPSLEGVRIEFDREKLIGAASDAGIVYHGSVNYQKLADAKPIAPSDLEIFPFLKRYPYSDEGEYRFLTGAKPGHDVFVDIPISADIVRGITLSPSISKEMVSTIRDLLRCISGFEALKVRRSTLLRNEKWLSLGAGLHWAGHEQPMSTARIGASSKAPPSPSPTAGSMAR